MQDNLPLVKILFLKKEGRDQRLVVNDNTFLNGKVLTVEVWLRNKHGVWLGTVNQIELSQPFLKAGDAYEFRCAKWDAPKVSEDRIPVDRSL